MAGAVYMSPGASWRCWRRSPRRCGWQVACGAARAGANALGFLARLINPASPAAPNLASARRCIDTDAPMCAQSLAHLQSRSTVDTRTAAHGAHTAAAGFAVPQGLQDEPMGLAVGNWGRPCRATTEA